MIYSMFISPGLMSWTDDVNDPSQADFTNGLITIDRQNILFQRVEKMMLDSAGSRSITLANYVNTEWLYLVYRVVGNAYLSTAGLDTDGATPITGKLPAYGTSLLPGVGIISTYNLNTLSIVSQADGTTIELFAAVACADDDARYSANA